MTSTTTTTVSPAQRRDARHAFGTWYAIRVMTGSEERARNLIEEADEADSIDELFVPRCSDARYDDETATWIPRERVLFPGYLIAVTKSLPEMESALVAAKAYARALGDEYGAVPLSDDEVSFIDAFTKRGHRTIAQSEGYITEGGHVIVTDGPLVGKEALIVKIRHRQKRAVIRLPFCGRDIETEVGLRVVRSKRAREARSA